KYLAGLLEKIPADGSYVFESTEVTEFRPQPMEVIAGEHRVRAKNIVIATHVPLQGLVGTVSAALFQTKLAPHSTYAVGGVVHGQDLPEASFWDTGEPYDYLRIDQQGVVKYAILGGEDHKTGQDTDTEARFEALGNRFSALFPGADIDHKWSGQVIETSDGLPYVGETAEHQFVSTGYSGNGMTFGTLGAM